MRMPHAAVWMLAALLIGAAALLMEGLGAVDVDASGDLGAAFVDYDKDGVCNPGVVSDTCAGSDRCPFTPATQRPVDANGCSQQQVDSDKDGVCNPGAVSSFCTGSDLCWSQAGATVDQNGCTRQQVDYDKDGVCNPGIVSSFCQGSDSCRWTPAGATVDANGCSQQEVDYDKDGVCNPGVVSSLCYGSDSCRWGPAPYTSNGCPGSAPAMICNPVPWGPGIDWTWSIRGDALGLNRPVHENVFVLPDIPAGQACTIFLTELQGNVDIGSNDFVYIRSSTVLGDILVRAGAVLAFDYTSIYGDIDCEPGGVVWFYGSIPVYGTNNVYGQVSPTCEVHHP